MRRDFVLPILGCFCLMSYDWASAVFRAVTKESPVTVQVKETAVFTYLTSTPYELTEVRWIRIQDGKYSIINIFRNGKDQQRCDLPEYVGRTELVKEGLTRGSASLKLFNVSVADEGTYRCYLETVDYFDFVDLELKVTALGSPPKIDLEGFQDYGIKVLCSSSGWYPKPTLVNKDDDAEMGFVKEENGFYSIRYSRVITENSDRTFSCRIRTLVLNQELESSVYMADGLFPKSTDVFQMLFILALVCSLAAMVMLSTLYTCRRKEQGCTLPSSMQFTKQMTNCSMERNSLATEVPCDSTKNDPLECCLLFQKLKDLNLCSWISESVARTDNEDIPMIGSTLPPCMQFTKQQTSRCMGKSSLGTDVVCDYDKKCPLECCLLFQKLKGCALTPCIRRTKQLKNGSTGRSISKAETVVLRDCNMEDLF